MPLFALLVGKLRQETCDVGYSRIVNKLQQEVTLLSHRKPLLLHVRMRLENALIGEMEDTCGSHGGSAPNEDPVHKILDRPYATGGDHGNGDRGGYLLQHLEIIPRHHSFAVHTGEENFPGAEPLSLFRPCHRIESRSFRTAVREDFVLALSVFLVINRHDNG